MGAVTDVRRADSRATRRAARCCASLVVAAVLSFIGSSGAGPVREGSLDAGIDGADPAAAETPTLRAPLAGQDAAAPNVLPSLAPPAVAEAGAASSASAMAAEIMQEAANARGSEQAHDKQRANTRPAGPARAASAASPERTGQTEDAWDLRDMGKSALQWLKQGVPWLRSNADEEAEAERPVNLEAIDWSRLDGSAVAGGSRTAVTVLPAPAHDSPRDPLSTVGYGNAAAPGTPEPGVNVLRWISDIVRTVVEHPMTWLVVSLFVIGAFVVKKIDRRPTK